MRYVVENDLLNFSGWSGANEKIEYLWKNSCESYEAVSSFLEEESSIREAEGWEPMTDTAINDFIRFEMDDYLKSQGLYDEERDIYYGEEGWQD